MLLVLLALPLLSLLPADSPLQVSAYTLTLVGKILCYAIVALANWPTPPSTTTRNESMM